MTVGRIRSATAGPGDAGAGVVGRVGVDGRDEGGDGGAVVDVASGAAGVGAVLGSQAPTRS
ncbi:MAG: hypothetical protein ACPHJ1_03500, partial [Ilumatobacteraceae bacterium]